VRGVVGTEGNIVKSGEDIVAFIDQYMEWAMERPEGYADDAAGLESIFFVLDYVRQFAICDGESPQQLFRYSQYLSEQSISPRLFTTDEASLPHILTDEMKQAYQPFIEFWKGYLAWRDSQ
jgi:hypothetical protein